MIYKAEHKSGFTIIDNAVLQDNRLSLKARGLMAYLLSMPDDWKFSERRLSEVTGHARSAISGALKELEMAGYLLRQWAYDTRTGRRVSASWRIFEVPRTENRAKENNATD